MTESQTASPLPSTTHIPELGVVPLQPSASVSAITTSTSPAPTGETRSDDISPMVTTSSPLPAVEQSETAEVAPVPIPTNSPQEPLPNQKQLHNKMRFGWFGCGTAGCRFKSIILNLDTLPSHLASLESYNKSLSHAPREELVDYHIQEQNFASVAESTIASPAPRVELDLEEKQFFDPFRINAVDGKPLQQISLENRNTAISTASSMDEMTLDPRYTVRMSDFYASTISAHSMNDTDDADTILSLDLESVN
ncbi:hypothetical protein BDR26DRAFT_871986 [Obelidium mucronatum]|nr:hypothetical protein BDR26DRAFT_871986 [Obelidium mucronatum]